MRDTFRWYRTNEFKNPNAPTANEIKNRGVDLTTFFQRINFTLLPEQQAIVTHFIAKDKDMRKENIAVAQKKLQDVVDQYILEYPTHWQDGGAYVTMADLTAGIDAIASALSLLAEAEGQVTEWRKKAVDWQELSFKQEGVLTKKVLKINRLKAKLTRQRNVFNRLLDQV